MSTNVRTLAQPACGNPNTSTAHTVPTVGAGTPMTGSAPTGSAPTGSTPIGAQPRADPAAQAAPSVVKGEPLQIKVVAQDGSMVFFKCKPTTSFAKMFQAYGDRMGIQSDKMRFLFDGLRVHPHNTPGELEMEDGDCIDVMMEQVGDH